jgi:hypothetical protein
VFWSAGRVFHGVSMLSVLSGSSGAPPGAPLSAICPGGLPWTRGIYHGGALDLTGTITLSGDANSVWIFQAASTLTTAGSGVMVFQAAGENGTPGLRNVLRLVGSSAVIGSGSHFASTVPALSSITANAGATIEGRMLARNPAVALISDMIMRRVDRAARSWPAPRRRRKPQP